MEKMAEAKKMGLFNRTKKKSQEELDAEFTKLDQQEEMEDTGVIGTEEDYEEAPQQPKRIGRPPMNKPGIPVKPNISQNKPVSQPEEENMPSEIKEYAEAFNNEFARIIEPDKNFNMLFALYCEQKRTNKLLEELLEQSQQ